MDMPEDESLLKNQTEHGPEPSQGAARPAWAITTLASVLIFTTVVDVLGNLLVIVSVLRNRKLRNAGNVFVVSLAFADLVVAFYPYPLVLYAIFHDGWSLGETNCKVCGGGGWQVWLVSNQLIGCRWESLIRLAWFIIKSDSSRLLVLDRILITYRFLPACNHQSRLENLLPRHPCVTRTEGFS